MTTLFVKSSILAFCFVVSASLSNAKTANTEGLADDSLSVESDNALFVLAQTTGMERRNDRRTDRRDCRQEEGVVGKDKRDCKQEERKEDAQEKDKKAEPSSGEKTQGQ